MAFGSDSHSEHSPEAAKNKLRPVLEGAVLHSPISLHSNTAPPNRGWRTSPRIAIMNERTHRPASSAPLIASRGVRARASAMQTGRRNLVTRDITGDKKWFSTQSRTDLTRTGFGLETRPPAPSNLGVFSELAGATELHVLRERPRAASIPFELARDYLDALVALGPCKRQMTVSNTTRDRFFPRPQSAHTLAASSRWRTIELFVFGTTLTEASRPAVPHNKPNREREPSPANLRGSARLRAISPDPCQSQSVGGVDLAKSHRDSLGANTKRLSMSARLKVL